MRRLLIAAVIICITMAICASGDKTESSFEKGVPSEFAGSWICEPLASDGETDTSFYAMDIAEDGVFSMYDFAAGNPGISGDMGNFTEETITCSFDMDDFDVPFCWELKSPEDVLEYECDGETLRLGHNGVWMTFNKQDGNE